MDPRRKISSSPSFCLRGTCNFTTIGSGRQNRTISDMMLTTAVAMYNDGRLMQVPVWFVMSKLMAIGVHAKISAKNIPIVYPAMKRSDAHVASRNHLCGDSRK
jgi:hypothetical protein